MAEDCVHCGHGWSEHHNLSRVDNKFGEVRPCDALKTTGRCACARYTGRTVQYSKWLITWSSSTGRGHETVSYPDHLNRSEVISRYESAHYGCYVDRLESRGGDA